MVVKGRLPRRGKNGVYDCNRLGGRTTRVVLAVLPIIVELLYRRAFVETPRSLTFSLPPSILLSFSPSGLWQEKGMKRTVKERERERERERAKEWWLVAAHRGLGWHRATTVGRYLSFPCVAKVPRPIGVARLRSFLRWRFYLVAAFSRQLSPPSGGGGGGGGGQEGGSA